jgi:hypothetical protein
MWFNRVSFNNPTGNFIFSLGWFFINLYTTCYLYYKKSPFCIIVTNWYNMFIPNYRIEYIPNAENCDFIVYTFDKIHKKISRPGIPLLDQQHKVLKESPFLSTEILVTSIDGKSVSNYEVEFRTDHYDYYVEGNIFHPKFISYFMMKHYYINVLGCDYSIHAVDRKTFDPIVFLKSDDPIKISC